MTLLAGLGPYLINLGTDRGQDGLVIPQNSDRSEEEERAVN